MGKPEIRFKGYTDEWEQRKLGDVTESIKNGYTYKADGSREHQYKITRIESISSGAINIEKLGSSDNVNENYKLEDGDILFSHINSLPYIANTAIYTSNLGEIYHGMNLLNIRAKHEIIDSHFLLHLLKKESSRNWFRIIAKPAVNQASISTTEVSSFVFMMPNMEEQKRISSVLDNIDNLLTLHQRKCDEVKSLKKYMLQKMFPQNEQKVPEIRFEGFTEAWEQRKLGDVAQEFKSGNSLKADEIDITGDYPVYGGNGLRGYTSTYNHDGEYALIGRQGALCGNMNYSAGKAYFTEHAVVVKADENNVTRFLYYMLNIMNLGQYSDQSAQPGLAVNKLVKLENSFPKKEEQQQIGAYFRSLDHLITLHQRKPIPHPNHPTIHTKHKGEEKYVRIRVNDREKINRTANLRRFPVDIPGGFKNGGRSVGEFQIYSGAE